MKKIIIIIIVKKKKIVLQYSFCIADRKRNEGCLYCNTIFLYCD